MLSECLRELNTVSQCFSQLGWGLGFIKLNPQTVSSNVEVTAGSSQNIGLWWDTSAAEQEPDTSLRSPAYGADLAAYSSEVVLIREMQAFRIRKALCSRCFQPPQWSSEGMGQLRWLKEITIWELSEV